MSRGTAIIAPGHTAVRVANHGPLPHDSLGRRIGARMSGPGHCKCACGALSETRLPGAAARERWHARHREELTGQPWSDVGMLTHDRT